MKHKTSSEAPQRFGSPQIRALSKKKGNDFSLAVDNVKRIPITVEEDEPTILPQINPNFLNVAKDGRAPEQKKLSDVSPLNRVKKQTQRHSSGVSAGSIDSPCN
jgi:hypothetical protein